MGVILFSSITYFPTRGYYQDGLIFNADYAWSNLQNYSVYSPILPNSSQNQGFLLYSKNYFENYNWSVQIQNWTHTNEVPLHNFIARSPNSANNIIILGAHYDARTYADKDPDYSKRHDPVPGINDGGSGVSILFELARVLEMASDLEVWIVLFDAEDQGNIPNWNGGISGWCIGSTYFVNSLNQSIREKIKLVMILDIVGGIDLVLKREGSSNPYFIDQIWNTANNLGFNNIFLNVNGGSIIDDHTPFLNRGFPAVDIIQQQSIDGKYTFFEWHHTTNDTIDNCDKNSLFAVGRVTEVFLESLNGNNIIYSSDYSILIYIAVPSILVVIVGLIILKRKEII